MDFLPGLCAHALSLIRAIWSSDFVLDLVRHVDIRTLPASVETPPAFNCGQWLFGSLCKVCTVGCIPHGAFFNTSFTDSHWVLLRKNYCMTGTREHRSLNMHKSPQHEVVEFDELLRQTCAQSQQHARTWHVSNSPSLFYSMGWGEPVSLAWCIWKSQNLLAHVSSTIADF